MFHATQEYATGVILHHVTDVDGHCMISMGARLKSDNAGIVAQFINSAPIPKV